MASEFEIIRRYFARPAPSALLGAGDDCALIRSKPELALAVTTDMLLEGRHFRAGIDARKLGHKALAVNLSDLAAMGADPRWALLSLALPEADESWLEAFSEGFHALARRHGVDLIGGDTTRGALSICVTLLGELPPDLALRRDTAMAGDDVWVSGATGEASLGIAHLEGRIALAELHRERCLARLDSPEPRVELGGRLRGLARSAIDVSDGLMADLGHIVQASGLGAEIWAQRLPRAEALEGCGDAALAMECITGGGDDYELVFTAPPSRRDEIVALSAEIELALTRIGRIVADRSDAVLLDAAGDVVAVSLAGFDHFR